MSPPPGAKWRDSDLVETRDARLDMNSRPFFRVTYHASRFKTP